MHTSAKFEGSIGGPLKTSCYQSMPCCWKQLKESKGNAQPLGIITGEINSISVYGSQSPNSKLLG